MVTQNQPTETETPDTSTDKTTQRQQRLKRGVLWVSAVAVGLYVGAAIYADVGALGEKLKNFYWPFWGLALALSVANYGVRAVRWQYYLRCVGVQIGWLGSARVFVAGFALSASPGKVGELLKSWLMKEQYGVEVQRTAPIVLVERLTDFLGLSLLSLVGLVAFRYQVVPLIITVLVVMLGTALLGHGGFGRGVVGRLKQWPRAAKVAAGLEVLLLNTKALLAWRALGAGVGLSVLGWGIECCGFYLILKGFGGSDAPLLLAVFVHAASSILGAVSMLPGGIGLTEGLMMGALVMSGAVPDEATAVAATLLNRLATLWFAVVLGFGALGLSQRRIQKAS